MRIMYDTTDIPATSIPADAEMVAGYIDGRYQSFGAVVARCPRAVRVPIAVFPSTNGGVVLDCESGDARPDQCPGWITRRRAAGIDRPTIYCELSQLGEVLRFCRAAGYVLGVHFDVWYAHYDGSTRNEVVGAAAKQFRDTGPHGENVDMSAVYDDGWPHVTAPGPPPPPPPPPPPLAIPDNGTAVVLNSTGAHHG